MSAVNSFGAKGTLAVGDASYEIYRLSAVPGLDKLPVLAEGAAENLLRTEDGANITADHINALGGLGRRRPARHRDRVHPGAGR